VSWLIDPHCHTAEHSYDGRIPAADLAARLYALGFGGVVFTDHNYCWPAEELQALRASAALAPDFVVLSGQEVRTALDGVTTGDLLVYGPVAPIPDDTSPMEVFRLAREANGFCIAPHPAVPRIGFGAQVESFPVAGIEVWNGRHGEAANRRARELWERVGGAATGGSDAHHPADIGGGGTVLARPIATLAELGAALMAGESAPWKPGVSGMWSRLKMRATGH